MKIRFTNTFLPAAGISILAASPCLSQGAPQGAIAPSPELLLPQENAKTPRKWMHQIRLTWVKPSVMALWLAPENNPQPAGAIPTPPDDFVLFKLPAGIDRIVAIDPQNALLIFGTDEDVRKLRELIQFLDRPQDKIPLQSKRSDQINVVAQLVTMPTEELSGIWAALSTQTGRATPAVAYLKPEEKTALNEQIGRRKANLERGKHFNIRSGANQVLDFQPLISKPNSGWWPDFHSDMPIIPPPPDFNENIRMPGAFFGDASPFQSVQLLLAPTIQPDNSVSLELRELKPSGIFGRATSARFDLLATDKLAFALPDFAPGTRAFLLFTTSSPFQYGPLYRTPNLGALPNVGSLFKMPSAPQKTP